MYRFSQTKHSIKPRLYVEIWKVQRNGWCINVVLFLSLVNWVLWFSKDTHNWTRGSFCWADVLLKGNSETSEVLKLLITMSVILKALHHWGFCWGAEELAKICKAGTELPSRCFAWMTLPSCLKICSELLKFIWWFISSLVLEMKILCKKNWFEDMTWIFLWHVLKDKSQLRHSTMV